MREILIQDPLQGKAVADLLAERERQDKKWGEQNHDPIVYCAIVQEELGEAFKEALESKFQGLTADFNDDQLRTELVQTAASAVAAIETLDRRKWKWGGA